MNSISPSKLGRYLLYATGEILIIVLGIIVALAVNNWNEKRKNRTLEIKTLHEIKNGFEDDLIDIRGNLQIQQSAFTSSNVLINCIKNQMKFQDSLKFHFANSGAFSLFIARTGPFETLKTRGLDIISNDSIRMAIAKIYDYDYEWIMAFEDLIMDNIRNYNKYLISDFKDVDPAHSAFPLNYDSLIQVNNFVNLIKYNLAAKSYLIDYYKLTELRINTLIVSIENEIKRIR